MFSFAAILPAAGQSIRFGGRRNKLLEMLAGRPVMAWSVDAFLRRADVQFIIIATAHAAELQSILPRDSRIRFVAGGVSRAQSVRNALAAVPEEVEWVAIHDAARPLVSQTLIDRTLAAARKHGAAVPALAVELTIKEAHGPLPAKVARTLSRQSLYAMQTPQIMRSNDLRQAFDHCTVPLEQVTDDAQLLELDGRDVYLVEGDVANLKLTTPQDLALAELMLRREDVKRET
jgi:2-C-methyl-D-erythritol 4-phosphate cytidylyltransferase